MGRTQPKCMGWAEPSPTTWARLSPVRVNSAHYCSHATWKVETGVARRGRRRKIKGEGLTCGGCCCWWSCWRRQAAALVVRGGFPSLLPLCFFILSLLCFFVLFSASSSSSFRSSPLSYPLSSLFFSSSPLYL